MASATIEPRLIALLNDTSIDFAYPRIDLPPLQNPNVLKAVQRPPPLEPAANTRNTQHDSLPTQQNVTFDRDLASNCPPPAPLDSKDMPVERALGGNSPHALRKILDDPDVTEASPKKRQRTNANKDDFVQLPQPPKKQKAVKQSVPPIIIGLFEPPPNAALFPPISSSSFHDSHGRNSLNISSKDTTEINSLAKEPPSATESHEKPVKSIRKPAVKARKKWSEAETNDLLRGVQRHGIGSWTKILNDSDFKFNGRRPVDLKDRFRTCCPAELIGKGRRSVTDVERLGSDASKSKSKFKSSLSFENILASCSDESHEDQAKPTPYKNRIGPLKSDEKTRETTDARLRKTRAHRKRLEDLADLGIRGPFKESRRRERKHFTEEEDRNILLGFQEFGPLWTTIQKDPRFGLESRRPTDLRDRLRNKYPERYFLEEEKRTPKELYPIAKPSLSKQASFTVAAEPSSSQELASKPGIPPLFEERGPTKPLTLPLPVYGSFSEFLGPPTNIEAPDSLSFTQSFEWADTLAPFTSPMGDMDISRLLLDDSCWNPISVKQRPSYTDISSICTTTSAGLEAQQILGLPVSSKDIGQ